MSARLITIAQGKARIAEENKEYSRLADLRIAASFASEKLRAVIDGKVEKTGQAKKKSLGME